MSYHNLHPNSHGIEVRGAGTVCAPYEIARFSITVSETAKTGLLAKDKIRKTVEAVTTFVDNLIQTGSAQNKVVKLTVDPHYEADARHVRHLAGYRASWSVKFETLQVSEVMKIQDLLTEFPQSEVASVTYGFLDPESLREEALERAWDAVKRRWEFQRKVLGITGNLSVLSWDVDYSEQAPMSKMAAPIGDTEPGLATVTVSLAVLYR